jgi:hypothetical protein
MAEGRDFVLARLAVARQHLGSSIEAIDGCISLFCFPGDDKGGKERSEALDIASEAAGEASRAIENAESALEGLGKEELAEEEPEHDEDDSADKGDAE